MSGPSSTEEWAAFAARRGWHVFPVMARDKKPATSGSWTKAASRSTPDITKWFASGSKNIGVACGPSRLVVIDEDCPGGFAQFVSDRNEHLPDTFTVMTREGRRHFYFAAPNDRRIGCSPGPLKKYGCDVKGDGGYVVAPGSTHETGSVYAPIDLDAEVAPLPAWLAEVLAPKPQNSEPSAGIDGPPAYAESALGAEVAQVQDATEGSRNDTLNSAAFNLGQLVGGGLLGRAEVERELLSAALHSGLDERSSRNTIASGLAKGMERPRTGPRQPPTDAGAWQPLDLSTFFEHPPPPAERFGSGELLYRGALHWFAGEPEAGKSLLLLHWAVEEMRLGNKVLLLDEEAGDRDVLSKLRALGATRDLLAGHLIYLQPKGRDIVADRGVLLDLVARHKPSIIGVDAAAAHLSAANLDEDRAPDVTKFVTRALLPLAHEHNAAVVVLDHKTKSGDSMRYARGSGAKLAKADVAFNVMLDEPFSKTKSGRLRIESTKDRLGDYGRGATWTVDVDTGRDRIALRFGDLTEADSEALKRRVRRGPNGNKDAAIRAALLEYIGANPGATTRNLRGAVPGAGSHAIDRFRDEAITAGIVRVDVVGQSRKHYLVEQQLAIGETS